jgi:solute carrier family 45 protein 1/2/4
MSAKEALLTISKIRDIIGTIYDAARHLPKPVRRVCIVQIAAFMGWFPYLFYSTTYVAEVMAHELGHAPDIDDATRAGSLALLIYSFGECKSPRLLFTAQSLS